MTTYLGRESLKSRGVVDRLKPNPDPSDPTAKGSEQLTAQTSNLPAL